MENEPLIVDLANSETPQAEPEAPKKRKYTKKKAEKDSTKPPKEPQQAAWIESKEEIRPELIHYAHKLEFELISARKKLKKQRKKFRKMMSSLTSYLGDKGINYEMIDDYVQAIGLDLEDSDNEMDYEKLFTLHKYRLVQEKGIDYQEPKKIPKKVSEGKAQAPGQENEDLMIMMSTKPEKPKKKKEKDPNAPTEDKPKKKREKKKKDSDEHNANSNSTAPTVQHEPQEPKTSHEFIQIEDEDEPEERPQKAALPNKGLTMPQAPMQLPTGLNMLDFLKNTPQNFDLAAMQRALLSNLNNMGSNPFIPPQLLESFKNISK